MTRPLSLTVLGAVALGGALGACLRWSLTEAFPGGSGSFPWTTFLVNLSGCALLALLPSLRFVRRRPLLRPALGTGVLGGFTTLSAYAEEARALLADGHDATAAAYVLGTLGACLLAVAVVDHLAPRAGEDAR